MLCDPENLRNSKTTILVTRSTDTDERNVSDFFGARLGTESPTGHGFRDGLFQQWLDDRAFRGVDTLDFVQIEVDASNVMSVLCQAGGDDGANITQTKNSNLHRFRRARIAAMMEHRRGPLGGRTLPILDRQRKFDQIPAVASEMRPYQFDGSPSSHFGP